MLSSMSDTPFLWTAHIDGSAKPNPGKMHIGGVVHRPDGSVWTFSEPVAHHGCNNEAEALAAIHALQWLHQQAATHVRLLTDNSILAEQLSQPHAKPIARLAPVYAQARALLGHFVAVHIQWVPRHKNEAADALARAEITPVLTAN